MKQSIRILFFALFAITLITGCSKFKIVSDRDYSEDFTQFKTYEFLGWTEDGDVRLTPFDKQRIEDEFVKQALKRGLTRVDSDGDVIVTLFITKDIRTQINANTTTTGMGMGGPMGPMMGPGMRGPGWGWGGGMGMGMGMGMSTSHTTINESNYVVGTLMVEMFDRVDKKLIWQAMGTKTINDNPKKRKKQIPSFVSAIMREYPVKKSK